MADDVAQNAVLSDPYTVALGEFVKEMLGVKQALADPRESEAPQPRWGAGNPRSPHYKPSVPLSGPEGDQLQIAEGRDHAPTYLELPGGLRVPHPGDIAERWPHHLRGAAQNAVMGMGYGTGAGARGQFTTPAGMALDAATATPAGRRLTAGLGASAVEALGSSAAHAGDAPPPPGWGGDDKALQVDIGRRPLDRPQVGAGEHNGHGGLPYLPPLPQRDPGEIRTTEPAADWWVDKGVPPEVALPLTQFGRATGDAAADIAGRPLMKWGARKVDALSTDLAAMANDLPPLVSPAEAQGAKPGQETPEEIMQIQRDMQKAGKYFGPIDGQRGTQTNKAIKDWAAEAPARAAAEAAKRQQDIEAGKNTAATAAAEAQRRDAEAKSAETKRLQDAAAQKRTDLGLGEKALRQSDTEVPVWQQIARNDGEALGWMAGAGIGHVIRSGVPLARQLMGGEGGVVGRYNTQTREVADEVNSVIDNIRNKDWHARVGDVNEVWRRGQQAPLTRFGQQPQVPFSSAPGQSPPWTPNPNAPPISELYQPNRLVNLGKDVAIPAAGAVESGLGHVMMRAPAEAELVAAQKAYDENPNSASNIERLQNARTAVGVAKFVEFIGRGQALGYSGSSIIHGRNHSQPNLNAADSERGRINDWLTRARGAPEGGGRGPPPAAPAPQPGPAAPPSVQSAAPSPVPAAPAPAPVPAAPPAPKPRASRPTAQSSPPPSDVDLPEGHVLTEWGVRGQKGQWASKPDALKQSTAKTKADKPEQSVNSPAPQAGPRQQMDESGAYVKPEMPIQEDIAPYGRQSRPNGRHSSNRNSLLELMG